MYLLIVFCLLMTVDWESCDEEEAELDDTEKAKARRYDILLCLFTSVIVTHVFMHVE